MEWDWCEEPEAVEPDSAMTTDARLLDAVVSGARSRPIVRIFTWDRKAVTVGRLQSMDTVRQAFPDVPLVRRPTGGRAVVHGEDLTISIVAADRWIPSQAQGSIVASYDAVAVAVIGGFAKVGETAEIGTGQGGRRGSRRLRPVAPPVDCFASTARCDIVNSTTGAKIAGAAQRRIHDVWLQQISLPFAYLGNVRSFLSGFRRDFGSVFNVTTWHDIQSPWKQL